MYKRYRSGGETSTPDEKKTDESSNKNKEEVVDELVVKEVEKCWEVIDSQTGKPSETKILPEGEKSVSVGAWKTVRVFVSSTFTDFFNEREVLVKKVFPELREWCEERKIQLIECDLRWGVPKDSNTHDTICACMEELDRCFQENDGQPFFLNLLSERFGWVPTEMEVPEDIRTRYNWVTGASITLMEILHGAYRTKNPNAAFFVRDGKFLKDIPKEYMRRFSDEKPASKQHLKVLKQKLKQNFPSQVYPYSCHVTGVTEVNGRQRVALSGLEEFAENVITWMKKTITQVYPDQESVKDLSQEEQEMEYHRLFMEKKSEFVIGRNLLVDTLLSYAKGESIENIKISDPATSFVRDSEFWKVCDEDNMVMCVTGAVGHGKTSVMAKVVREALKTGIPVFYHFVGCTGNSRQTEVLVQRLVHTLTGCGTVTDILDKEITDSPVQVYMELLRDKFPKMREKNLEYLLVIDGVNELAEYETHNHLVWLPPKFPGRVRCIVSTANNHPPTINRLQEHRSYVIDVGPIDTETAKEMIRIYFQQYSKKLEAEQIEMIISRPCSQNPIWLWLLMEELRIFGDHRMLAEKIGNISDSVENLLSDIINRLIKEDDTDLIKKMLCLLAASRGGLALQDLLKVIGDPENKEPLPQLYWSKIRRLLKPYLRFVGHREHVVFVHSSILQAVWDNLLCKYGDIKDVHQDLAKYFLNWCDDLATIVDNVPYHCMEAGMKDRLIEFLRKRQEATYINDFNRSRYFDKFRCKNLADPVIAANMPVVMCRSCTFQKSSFSPRLDRNKTVCVICGAFVFPNNKQVKGHYCMSHSVQSGQNKVIGKCVVCKNMVPKDKDGKVTDIAGMYGQLCMHCSLGFHAKQCCMV